MNWLKYFRILFIAFFVWIPEVGAQGNAADGIIVISPQEGQAFRDGDTVQIIADTSARSDIVGLWAQIGVGLNPLFIDEDLPLGGSFAAGADKLGDVELRLIFRKKASDPIELKRKIRVLPSQPFQNLYLGSSYYTLRHPNAQEQILVYATMDNKVSSDVSSSVLGTTYQTASGTSDIVRVSSDGILSPVATGKESVIVRNGSLSATLEVSVELPE